MLYYKLYTFRFATKFTKYSQSTNATSLQIKLIVSMLQPETANIRLFSYKCSYISVSKPDIPIRQQEYLSLVLQTPDQTASCFLFYLLFHFSRLVSTFRRFLLHLSGNTIPVIKDS